MSRRRRTIRAIEIAHVTMPCNPPRPNQDGQRRPGGQGASGLPSGRGAARVAGGCRHQEGPILRAIGRRDSVEKKALTPQSINLIVKRRCAMVGLELEAFFGARTSRRISDRAARRGIAPPEAMQQSQHRSVQQTASYYNDAERAQGRAAGLGL
jgi:hypothetical protein